ncbi:MULTISPECIES: STAS domain-containing protein [Basfia]|uniref:STAS domain-containing protein n=1 Tax=Mannheimia succiniciproducens (strain KCTC 0769BP / MBEL55E) TaxID=221988 RepID=Q65RU4_MANSM|nr:MULTISPECIES: STAS domain-containing protein [Basfia]AAU38316.1 unknown [[Mannheimia] succiniciproducens MBEL55E]SEQ37363.1 phospholipid transport system transporter-binding protein [Basfia succiniciproducens]
MQAEKHLKWAAEQNDDRIAFRLDGELSRDTLLPLWNEFQKREQRSSFLSERQIADKNISWDLSQVSRIDSAGFALLCDLLHYCQAKKNADKTLLLENVPPQLLTLADLVGLADWIKPYLK